MESSVQSWLDGTVNNGWVIKTAFSSADNWTVYSSENSVVGGRPILSVTYTLPPSPPVVANLGGDSVAYTEGDGAVIIEQGNDATVSDTDSADFSGGSLTVSFVSGSDSAEDVLAIRNQGTGAGQIGVSGGDITYGGVTIGSFSGGSSGANLVISFNGNATPAAAEALIRNVTFEDIDKGAPTTGTRTVRFVLNDGDGSTSANYDTSITVSAVNDAPGVYLDGAPVSNLTIAGGSSFFNGDGGGTHNRSFDTGADGLPHTAAVTVNLTTVDNSFDLQINGQSITTGNSLQLTGAPFAGQSKLSFAGTDIVLPWISNPNGPRIIVTITETGVTFMGLRDTTTSTYEAMTVTSGNLQLPTFVSGNNTLTVVNPHEAVYTPDGISGNIVATVASSGIYTTIYTENGPAVSIADTDAVIYDVDDTNIESAAVTLTNQQTGDRLLVNGSSAASGVLASGIAWTRTDSLVTLSGTFTKTQYAAALQSVQFENTIDTPSTTPRVINTVVDDGSANSNTSVTTINITVVADAPVTANLAGDSLSYNEGDGAVVIEQGGDIAVTDADSADFAGGSLTVSFAAGSNSAQDILAIRNEGSGAGQIGISGASVTYGGVTIGSFAGGSSGTDLVISFNSNATPAAVAALVRNITFENTDTSAPTPGARTVRYVIDDGGGGISANYDTTVTVSGVNDAPVLDTSKNPALVTQNEDSGAPSGAVGTLISSLVDFATPAGQVDNVTDADSGAATGVAVIAADTTNGTWFYSIDNGANWSALGAVTDSNARLLAASAGTRIYFQPNADYNGTIANAIVFRAWDRSSGTNGSIADASVNGGTTAFSAAADAAIITITAVNDAPSLVNGATASLPDVFENSASVGTSVNAILAATAGADTDGGAMKGIAVTNAIGNGVWQYSTDGTNWTNFGNVSAANALLLDGSTQIRYLSGPGTETAKIGFVAWDRTSGTASSNSAPSYANPGSGGGASAYSSESSTAAIVVRPTPVTGIGFVPPAPMPSLNIDPLALNTEEMRASAAASARLRNPALLVALASGFAPPAKLPGETADEDGQQNALLATPAAPVTPNLNVLPPLQEPAPPVVPAGTVDLALNDFDRDAFREALNREIDDLKEPDGVTHAVLMQVLSGSSVALTAGAVGWMLRGGALASALLSSMPVLKGFDPLVVAMRPDKDKTRRPDSLADRLFEKGPSGESPKAEGVS